MYWIINTGRAVWLRAVGGLFRTGRLPEPDAARPYCRCPHCNRKLHHHAERVGRPVRCPGCLEAFLYPAAPLHPNEDVAPAFRLSRVQYRSR